MQSKSVSALLATRFYSKGSAFWISRISQILLTKTDYEKDIYGYDILSFRIIKY